MDQGSRGRGSQGGPEVLTLRPFRYFIAAAEAETVSRAAQRIGISQSAITAPVQALEDETSAVPLVRHQKGVRLSHEGHRMLRHARQIVGAVADARRAVGTRHDDLAGGLSLGVTRMVSGYYLADFLSRFRRVYRRVEIRIVEEERGYLEHLLVNGEIDVGLPASGLQKRVSPRWRTPVPAIWLGAVLSVAATLYSPAFAALAAGCALLLYVSYAMPVAAGLLAEGRRWTVFGPFRLGALSKPFATITVLGVLVPMYAGIQPPFDILVNYAVGLVVLPVALWFGPERRRFQGPPVGQRQADIAAAETAGARG